LQTEVQKYWAEGFDFLYNPLLHESENVFVQWVQKWKSLPADALVLQEEQKLLDGVQSEISGFKMVADVQPVQLVEWK